MAARFSALGYLRIGSNGVPNNSAAKTVTCWLEDTDDFGGYATAWNLLGISHYLQFGYRSGQMIVWYEGGFSIIYPNIGVPFERTFYGYTYDGAGNHVLYVNGTKYTNTYTLPSDAMNEIALFGNPFIEQMSTTISDFRIYDRALSDDELKTVYHTLGGDGIVQGLVTRLLFTEYSENYSPEVPEDIIDLSIKRNNGINITESVTALSYLANTTCLTKKRAL